MNRFIQSMRARALSVALLIGALAFPARAADTPPPPADPLPVAVCIVPQEYFVERVAGALVRIETLVGPGRSHETYDPTPRQVARLAQSRLLFTLGLPFERRLTGRLADAAPDLRLVDLTAGLTLRQMETGHDHAHGDHDHAATQPATDDHAPAHAAGAPDPHVWLGPTQVRQMARTIRDALAAELPAQAGALDANLARFLADIDALDARLKERLAPLRGREVFVFHPAFGYFTDAYGLVQSPIEIEGKEPGPRQLADLIETARARGCRVIFVQPQFSTKSAEAIARGIGGAVAPLDPLARDWLANLETMARAIEQGLGQPAGGATP